MCRLSVYSKSGNLDKADRYIFGVLLILSARLGNTHGTGIAINSGSGAHLKTASEAKEFAFKEHWRNWWAEAPKANTVFGHTRLASSDFRVTTGQHTVADAHPFLVGDVIGAHNGIFKEWERLAKENNLTGTDSQIFFTLLSQQPDNLVELLKKVGVAEYSLVYTSRNSKDVIVVRGNRTLYLATTNRGLIINTSDTNIKDLVDCVNPGLAAFDLEELKIEKIEPLPEYTLWKVNKGQIEKLSDFGAEVKAINDPPVVVTTYATGGYQQGAFWQGRQRNSNNQGKDIDGEEIANRTIAILHLLDLVGPRVSDSHLLMAINELFQREPKDLVYYTAKDVKHFTDICVWAWNNYPSLAPTDEKADLWIAISDAANNRYGCVTVKDTYAKIKELGFELDVPFFHNNVEVLQNILAAVGG